MEFIDTYTSDRTPLHTHVPRVTHGEEGVWAVASHIWIFNAAGEFLLQRRSLQKRTSPNCLDLAVAGYVLSGETPLHAAIREAREELGITVEESELKHVGSFVNEPHRIFHETFTLIREIETSTLTLQVEEFAEVLWMPMDQLREELAKNPEKFVAREAEWKRILAYNL
jgi:8-oxo-dGTP pyrophosphatase MutT (NUDIX family)